MIDRETIERMLDKSDTVSDAGYAGRLIARATVLALLEVAEAVDRQAKIDKDLLDRISKGDHARAAMETIKDVYANEHMSVVEQELDTVLRTYFGVKLADKDD